MLGHSALSEAPISALASTSTDATASPGIDTLVLTGFAPSVSAGASVTPAIDTLVLTGFAPSVSDGSAPVERTRGGGKDDGRRLPHVKRKAYVDWSKRRETEWERKKQEALYRELGLARDVPAEPVEARAELPPEPPPPLPIAEAQGLSPKVEYDRIMEVMAAGLAAIGEEATRLHTERLRKQAKKNKIVPPDAGEDRDAETRALVDWLDARAKWIEQQAEAEAAFEASEALRIAEEAEDEEEVALVLAMAA